MNGERSRFVCAACTKRLRALVICDEPFCGRCTRKCQIQPVLSPDEPLPPAKTRDGRIAEKILGGAVAQGRFRLPQKEIHQ